MQRQPTLEDDRDYFREQAANVTLPDKERDLWRRLADELDHRINADPEHDQTELW